MLPNRSWPAAAGPNGAFATWPRPLPARTRPGSQAGGAVRMGRWRARFPAGRSRGVTVAVEGFFAFVWFGWGQADAPSWLVIPLAVGAALGVLLAVAGVVVAKRSPGPLPAASDPAVRRRYRIILGLEFGLLG